MAPHPSGVRTESRHNPGPALRPFLDRAWKEVCVSRVTPLFDHQHPALTSQEPEPLLGGHLGKRHHSRHCHQSTSGQACLLAVSSPSQPPREAHAVCQKLRLRETKSRTWSQAATAQAEPGLGLAKPHATVPATSQACLPVATWSSLQSLHSVDSVASIHFLAHESNKAKPLCCLGHPPKGNPATTARFLLLPVLKEILSLCSCRPEAS